MACLIKRMKMKNILMMNEKERQTILKWAEDSGTDEKTMKQIRGVLDDADALEIMGSVNVEKALAETKGKIRKSRMRNVFRRGAAAISTIAACAAVAAVCIYSMSGNRAGAIYAEYCVNPGMTGTIILPDSTVVVLNGGSKLSYSKDFNHKTRDVRLCGEAYFDVTKDTKSPFIVRTGDNSSIMVYGTQFNVDAYDGDSCVATLINGSIGFHYTGKYGQSKELRINPGQKLSYSKDSDSVRVCETSGESEIAWKDGRMLLASTPLSEILHILSKRYGVKFDVRDRKCLEYRFSGGYFTMNSLERTLETLRWSSSFDWEYDESVPEGETPRIIIN